MSVQLPVTLLTDYGYEDEFAGVCRAVISRISPGSPLIDVSHGVPRQDIRRGALQLAAALPFAAPGVTVAVVDPGVGSPRLPVAVRTRTEGRLLVGPDNGLLWPAIEAFGGPAAAVDLSDSPHLLRPVSVTFHGRDIFAPVGAHLAAGAPLEAAGSAIDPGSLAKLELPQARAEDGRITAHVLKIDGFGNTTLDATPEDLEAAGLAGAAELSLRAAGEVRTVPLGRTFADVGEGEMVVYAMSVGRLAVAVNLGSAASELGVVADDEVVLAGAP